MNRNLLRYLIIGICFIYTVSCKKSIDNGLRPLITDPSVFTSNSSAAEAMTRIYIGMMSTADNLSDGPKSIGYLQGLAADELTNHSTDNILREFYTNQLTSAETYYWREMYTRLYEVNAVIAGVTGSAGITSSVRQQLLGEAKFIRAFTLFYAINLYGDVPMLLGTDYSVNHQIHRTPLQDVYTQIQNDLADAGASLSESYVDGLANAVSERIRPNRMAAAALLARVYLYTQQWQKAEEEAGKVIGNSNFILSNDLDKTFLSDSKEAIWQLQPQSSGYNTFDGYYFVLTAAPGSGHYYVSLNKGLASAFSADDKRLSHWVGSFTDADTYYYPNKYKIGVVDPSRSAKEYFMVLRLAEQYLIRSEARAQLGDLDGARTDIDIIRTRAGLDGTTAGNKEEVLAEIARQRRLELFTEWGDRWFDLKRTQHLNAVMSQAVVVKGGVWDPNWSLLPLPRESLLSDANLTQNPGY